jgi:hypothetical protein
LLREAKEGHFAGDTAGFFSWAEKKFRKTRATTTVYLAWCRNDADKPFKSFHEAGVLYAVHGRQYGCLSGNEQTNKRRRALTSRASSNDAAIDRELDVAM